MKAALLSSDWLVLSCTIRIGVVPRASNFEGRTSFELARCRGCPNRPRGLHSLAGMFAAAAAAAASFVGPLLWPIGRLCFLGSAKLASIGSRFANLFGRLA